MESSEITITRREILVCIAITLILIGIGMFILVKPIYIGISLVVIGALLILVLTGHEQKGVVSKTISGLGGLYNASGYLSDILSYSRILALSLSTSVMLVLSPHISLCLPNW